MSRGLGDVYKRQVVFTVGSGKRVIITITILSVRIRCGPLLLKQTVERQLRLVKCVDSMGSLGTKIYSATLGVVFMLRF